MTSVLLGEVSASIDYGVTASASEIDVGPKFLRITDIQDGTVDWNTVPYCYADPAHPPGLIRIMDGPRPRVIDPARFEASQTLPDLLRALDQHRVYVTSSERNYAVYNMTFTAEDGLSYTAFFTVRPRKGKFNGVRHSLFLFVESAYHIVQPQKGTKTKLPAILAQGLIGKMIKPRR